jgi:gamma-glutamyltranspeptidase/glutathione hydrolase
MRNFAFLLLLYVAAACTSPEKQAAADEASEKYYGAVATAHPLATQIGADVLRNGGNAFDAAVAVHYALAVVYPVAGNLGGGGFAVIYTANQQAAALDFRETAPHNAHRDMFLDQNGNADPQLSRNGHLAAGVPGSVAGIQALHDSLGSMPLKLLMQPAIDLAKDGYLLTAFGAGSLNYYRDEILKINKHVPFAINDSLWKAGDRFYSPHLAETLKRISDSGSKGFYSGETADLIAAEMKRGGGLITKEDLAEYTAVWREPVRIDYCGYEVLSMPPPSSG